MSYPGHAALRRSRVSAGARAAAGRERPRTAWASAAPRFGRCGLRLRCGAGGLGAAGFGLVRRARPPGSASSRAARGGSGDGRPAGPVSGLLGERLAALAARPTPTGLPRRARSAARSSGPGRSRRPGRPGAAPDSRRGAGQRVAVAAEVGEEEGAQPAGLADRLVHGLGQAQTGLDVLVGERGGVEGDGEGASEHTQLVCAERHAAAGSVWRGHGRLYAPNGQNPLNSSRSGAAVAARRLDSVPEGEPPVYRRGRRSARRPGAGRSASATARARRSPTPRRAPSAPGRRSRSP